MILKLEKKYKSLDPFDANLPDFTILTGVNGAGKTQILNGLVSQKIQLNDGEFNKLIKYIPNSILSPTDSATILSTALDNKIQELWQQYESFIKNTHSKNPDANITHYIDQLKLTVLNEIASELKKDIYTLDRADIFNHYPMDDGTNQKEIFYVFFSELFKRYKDKFTDNEFNTYLNQQKGHTETNFLTQDEFISKWGEAPWDFLNKLNESAGLNYIVNSPIQANKDIPFELTLKNTVTGAEVKFNELSSGEKAIMSLALALYNTNFEKNFPKVLLLDEPDGSLHPSMTKHFLAVIQNLFVKEKGLKVILTTHSPSTIAIANEEAIYVVNQNGNARIEKSSKDRALKILTEGVPSFSVNYENRRQVFVESPFDVQFYEKIYQKLSDKLDPEISLSFISSGDSRTDKNGIPVANCDQVIKITDILRQYGNKFVWGIIDFDGKNQSSNHIKTLGDGQRYSIENYLFDPILLAGILLREKFIERSEIGLTENETLSDFKTLTGERLQKIVDYVINVVTKYVTPEDTSISTVTLVDGRQVKIPNWYLQHPGHPLEAILIKTFPKLSGIKKDKEDLLKLDILDKVIDDVPYIISIDFLDAFKFIQERT